MLKIDAKGEVKDARAELHIVPTLARGKLGTVHGIVVHQTGGSSAQAAIAGYAATARW